MKIAKLSSIFLFSLLFLWVFIPEASAKRHSHNRTSFGLSFNLGNPQYVAAPAPVVMPAPVYPAYAPPPAYPTYAAPMPAYPTYVAPMPACPYYYSAPVVIQRPGVYVQPGFSYSYRKRY